MDLNALMELKIKYWQIMADKLQNELPKFRYDFDEVVKTKDAKTLRQKNIQNNISQAETQLLELEQFVFHMQENLIFIERPRDIIENWSLYRIKRSYISVNDMSLLSRRSEPKDHFVLRLPIATSFLDVENSFGYFEEIQTSISKSNLFDGLKRKEIFCVETRHSRDEWGQEQPQLFEVELVI